MFRTLLLAFVLLLSSQIASAATLTVMPLDNRAKRGAQDYLSLGLAEDLAERLEAEPRHSVRNARIPALGPAQAEFGARRGFRPSLEAMHDAAKRQGATHFVTGWYAGVEWKWHLTIEIYAVGTAPTLVGKGDVDGDQTMRIRAKSGRLLSIVSAEHIQRMLSDATEAAFAAAGLELSHGTRVALRVPPTKDAYAFILFSRALERHFRPLPPAPPKVRWSRNGRRNALDFASYAVRVDPDFASAQRLTAYLLERGGKAMKARVHYEIALKQVPSDIRSLERLGRIELAAKNAEGARDILKKAVSARPEDPETRYWLAQACRALSDIACAVSELERSRTLDPASLTARKELASLYTGQSRYDEAAGELLAVTERDPTDAYAAYELPANLRAAGKIAEATASYAAAEGRFTDDGTRRRPAFRFGKFRKELEAGGGSVLALVAAVHESKALVAELEAQRETFGLMANDAALDLTGNGKAACADGRGASSALTAREIGRAHAKRVQDLVASAKSIKAAVASGDAAALTSAERSEAGEVFAATLRSQSDAREMRSQELRVLLPLLRASGCPTDQGALSPAVTAQVRARTLDRRVASKKTDPPRNGASVSPDIPVAAARVIRFRIDNREGTCAYVLTVDDVEAGTIPANTTRAFTAQMGTHRLCLLPKERSCGPPGTVRQVYLHEGWTMTVKPGTAP